MANRSHRLRLCSGCFIVREDHTRLCHATTASSTARRSAIAG
jgi:hypothetical protein